MGRNRGGRIVAKSKSILVTQPADWTAAWERAAAASGLSLSAWIGRQCNRGLPKAERDALSDRPRTGRPKREGTANG